MLHSTDARQARGRHGGDGLSAWYRAGFRHGATQDRHVSALAQAQYQPRFCRATRRRPASFSFGPVGFDPNRAVWWLTTTEETHDYPAELDRSPMFSKRIRHGYAVLPEYRDKVFGLPSGRRTICFGAGRLTRRDLRERFERLPGDVQYAMLRFRGRRGGNRPAGLYGQYDS
jgi:hypothetical protein